MKLNFLKKAAIAIAITYAPIQTMAWGTIGHRVSGQIAEDHLTLKARQAIQAILGDESIAMASNWADFMRSDTSFKKTTPWHYIDLERGYSFPELVEFLNHDTDVDVYTQLNKMIADLKNKSLSKEKRSFALRMLIHLVEDIHQPLHTTGHEQGGNGVKLNWFNEPTNLHTVWDSKLVNYQELSYTEYVAVIDHAKPAQVKAWQAAPIIKWISESNNLAEEIYATVKPGETLGYNYNFKYVKTVNQQLLKGGIRLAGLLNQLFG